MKHKVSELEAALLDRVAWHALKQDYPAPPNAAFPEWWSPSTNWSQGGPIIERERIDIINNGSEWAAGFDVEQWQVAMGVGLPRIAYGPTPLIAAMRAYVASKFGEEVELP